LIEESPLEMEPPLLQEVMKHDAKAGVRSGRL